MARRSTGVRTFNVQMTCEVKDCKGQMLPNGKVLLSYPAKYVHVCTTCGNEASYEIIYPTIQFE